MFSYKKYASKVGFFASILGCCAFASDYNVEDFQTNIFWRRPEQGKCGKSLLFDNRLYPGKRWA